MRGLVAGCLAALALSMWVAPAASAAEEHCPGLHGGTAALDWGINASEQIGAGFASNLRELAPAGRRA